MEREKRVLQVGGLSGLVAGILLILAIGIAIALSMGGGSPGRPWEFGIFERLSGGFLLVIAVLSIPLYLALHLALRRFSPVSAPFGSASGALGLVLIGLSFAYGLGFEFYVGLLFVVLSFLVLGAVMVNLPGLGEVGGGSLFLGLAGIFLGVYSYADLLALVAVLLLPAIYLSVSGWQVYGMSKVPAEREHENEPANVSKTQPAAIRLLAVSLGLVGSFYVAFTIYVLLLEVAVAGGRFAGIWAFYLNVGIPSLILTLFGLTYIAFAFNLRQRSTTAWTHLLVASILASGISVLLTAYLLGFIGSLPAVPLAIAIPTLVLYGFAPAVPASLIGARRYFGINIRKSTSA